MSNVNHGGRIPAPDLQQDDERLLEFSFKYLDITPEAFSITRCTEEFLQELLQQIQLYSHWTVAQFTDQNNREHRHITDFATTHQPDGFITLDEVSSPIVTHGNSGSCELKEEAAGEYTVC